MEPSLRTVKRLFALSNNRCAYPNCSFPIVEESGTVLGIICHIKARNKNGPRYDALQTDKERHGFDNLMLMCGGHSKLIDSDPDRFTVEMLIEMKAVHERAGHFEPSIGDELKAKSLLKQYRNVYVASGGNLILNSPGAVQVHTLVVKSSRKSVKTPAPSGSIATNLSARNYVIHLIKRYNEFASQQPGRDYGYGRIYKTIEREFGAKWDYISLDLFGSLSLFLQKRIDGTYRGRINRGNAIPNYSTYEEYREKYEKRQSSNDQND